jgi:F-type H+-transporting ATPase subunit b
MKLILTIFLVYYFNQISLIAAEAGMPQLDPTYWASQAFWLILIFTSLYLILSKLFIPKIKDGIDDRENKIKDDLDEAQKLKNTAEKKFQEYEIAIENAKKEVQKNLFEDKNKLNEDMRNKKKIFEKEIELELKNTEREIENFKKNSSINVISISEEITSRVIEKISGETMNLSSVKAAVLETSKNMDKQ